MPLRSDHSQDSGSEGSPAPKRSSFGSKRSSSGGLGARSKKPWSERSSRAPKEPELDAEGLPVEPAPKKEKTPRDPKAVMFASAARMTSAKDWPAEALVDRLKEKFSDWPDAAALARATVDKLVELKAVDDVRYARGFIRQRATRKSVKTLLRELSYKKVSDAHAQEALAELVERGEVQDDNSSMIALWRRKFGALPVGEKEKAKQARYLASRGFSPSSIYTLWRDIAKGDVPLEE